MPRPPGYQRSAVLAQATEVFWTRGYGATSVNDLVAATGLKPGSLYAAFGSKKGLFLEVLNDYNAAFLADVEAAIAAAPGPLAAVRDLLMRSADATLGDVGRRGCLAVNALLEMAGHDEDIAATLRGHNERLRRRLESLLERARARGELADDSDPQSLSTFVLNNLWGMRVLCKSEPSRAALDSIISGVMDGLGAPRHPPLPN